MPRSVGDNTFNNNWILGLLIVIISVIMLFIYDPNYQKSIDNFINLDLQYQNIGGIYNNDESKLTKWNADNYQNILLTFKDVDAPINKVKLDFKDVSSNNLYTYFVENKSTTNLIFPFKVNLPPAKTYILLVYINDTPQPTFIKDISTEENYFNFTDITNQNIPSGVDSILSIKITNPDTLSQPLIEDVVDSRKRDLGTLKMQPYNMISIPVTIPDILKYKNLFRSSNNISPEIKTAHDQKITTLDSFVFKTIDAVIIIIGLPATSTTKAVTVTLNSTVTQEYEEYGVSQDELIKFERQYPNRVKVITPGIDGCVQGDSNKCSIIVKNLVHGAKYKMIIRAVYQQLGSIEPNIRYTKPQSIIFTVSNSSNVEADLNKTFNIADKAKQYVMNQAQKEYVLGDQNRQNYNLLNIENEINTLANKIYYSL